eukprot:TRINITY_DN2915_c0_g1_i3.p1 TRINITY_DN2915_c0_g1~~TRINITY_DN2915_c0_g1_i3.p1  ORF type:complete len:1092 (-),score=239.24 TRINITY_DN2915_c0_g1_i3:693-3968(-)
MQQGDAGCGAAATLDPRLRRTVEYGAAAASARDDTRRTSGDTSTGTAAVLDSASPDYASAIEARLVSVDFASPEYGAVLAELCAADVRTTVFGALHALCTRHDKARASRIMGDLLRRFPCCLYGRLWKLYIALVSAAVEPSSTADAGIPGATAIVEWVQHGPPHWGVARVVLSVIVGACMPNAGITQAALEAKKRATLELLQLVLWKVGHDHRSTDAWGLVAGLLNDLKQTVDREKLLSISRTQPLVSMQEFANILPFAESLPKNEDVTVKVKLEMRHLFREQSRRLTAAAVAPVTEDGAPPDQSLRELSRVWRDEKARADSLSARRVVPPFVLSYASFLCARACFKFAKFSNQEEHAVWWVEQYASHLLALLEQFGNTAVEASAADEQAVASAQQQQLTPSDVRACVTLHLIQLADFLRGLLSVDPFRQRPQLWRLQASLDRSMCGGSFPWNVMQACDNVITTLELALQHLSGTGDRLPFLVERALLELRRCRSDPSRARACAAEALKTWRALFVGDPTAGAPSDKAVEDIALLTAEHARVECRLRQYRQASRSFEEALSLPRVREHAASLWVQYAQFSAERGKHHNAELIFKRAARALKGSPMADTLWEAFYEFAVSRGNTQFTSPAAMRDAFYAEEMREAQQPQQQQSVAPEGAAVTANGGSYAPNVVAETEAEPPPQKRPKRDNESVNRAGPGDASDDILSAWSAVLSDADQSSLPAHRAPPSLLSEDTSVAQTLSLDVAEVVTGQQQVTMLNGPAVTALRVAPSLPAPRAVPVPPPEQEMGSVTAELNDDDDYHGASGCHGDDREPPLPVWSEVVAQLRDAMCDETTIEIALRLRRIQHIKAGELKERRLSVVKEQRNRMAKLVQSHRVSAKDRPAWELAQLNAEQERERKDLEQEFQCELHKFDKKILGELDAIVLEQQTLLQHAGVPGFFPTKSTQKLELQTRLLQLILEEDANRRAPPESRHDIEDDSGHYQRPPPELPPPPPYDHYRSAPPSFEPMPPPFDYPRDGNYMPPPAQYYEPPPPARHYDNYDYSRNDHYEPYEPQPLQPPPLPPVNYPPPPLNYPPPPYAGPQYPRPPAPYEYRF